MTKWEAIIICLLFIFIFIFTFDLYQISEVRNYIETFNNNPNVTSEYSFIKDYMDRNLQFYSYFSTALIAIITIIIALFVKYEFGREVVNINSKFDTFKEDQIKRNQAHELEFKEVRAGTYLAIANLSLNSSYSYSTLKNYGHAAFLTLIAILNYTKALKLKGIENDTPFVSSALTNLIAFLDHEEYKSSGSRLSIEDCNEIIANIPLIYKERMIAAIAVYASLKE